MMPCDSLVSIIMPGYNCATTVRKAVMSVINQTYSNWELLFVDDCSVDETVKLVRSYNDPRIKVIILKANTGGPVEPRNRAIREARGEYISFLDSDDWWAPTKLESQLIAMKEFNVQASHGPYTRARCGDFLKLVKPPKIVNKKMMLSSNYIGNLTGIYNCSVLGKFYQKNIGHEDYLMWLSILSNTDSISVDENCGYYSVSENSVSGNKFKAAMWHYNILRKEIGLGFLTANYYFSKYLFNAVTKRI